MRDSFSPLPSSNSNALLPLLHLDRVPDANLAQIRRTQEGHSDGVGESALEGRRGITIRLLAGSETGATSTGCSGCPPRETQWQQQ